MKLRRWPLIVGTTLLFGGIACESSTEGSAAATSEEDLTTPETVDEEGTSTGEEGAEYSNVDVGEGEKDPEETDGTIEADVSESAELDAEEGGTEGSEGEEVDAEEGGTEGSEGEEVDAEEGGMEGSEGEEVDAEEGGMEGSEGEEVDAEEGGMEGSEGEEVDAEEGGMEGSESDVADTGEGGDKGEKGACCTASFDCITVVEEDCPDGSIDFVPGLSCETSWPCPVPGFVGITRSGKKRVATRSLRRVVA